MKRKFVLLAFLGTGLISDIGAACFGATVDFDSAPPGPYGENYGQAPGDVILTTPDGVAMSVEEFFLGTFTGFIRAEIDGLYDVFPTPALQLDNISVLFDFADLDFDVTLVTLSYAEFGGEDNFAVNGHTIFELPALTAIPADVAPGVSAFVESGVITLTGGITDFRIGGQELVIDNVVALPEPGLLTLLSVGGAWLFSRPRRKR